MVAPTFGKRRYFDNSTKTYAAAALAAVLLVMTFALRDPSEGYGDVGSPDQNVLLRSSTSGRRMAKQGKYEKYFSHMVLLKPSGLVDQPPKAPANKDWKIPKPKDPKCPDFCGDPMEFAPFAKDPDTGITLDKGVGTKTFFRVHRPEWIAPMHKAVAEIDKHDGMDGNSYCSVFSSCKLNEEEKLKSRHSTPYMVCSDYDMIHASQILVGSADVNLPGYLKEEGDDNLFCQMARFISHLVETTIFPNAGWDDKKCIVQDFFVNQQMSGSKTNLHNHNDDTYGGVFYLDAPKGTRLCFSDSENDGRKKKWWKHAPELTERLFPDEPSGNYHGHVIPRAGDVVFFPVAWARHWVPKLTLGPNEKRTSVVFNMVCI